MGNIFIAIKRFFQNKNTVTIFAILVAVGIIYFAYNYRIKKSTEPVNVPYATKEIGPKTNITSDMVATRKVPGGVVTKDVITNSKNIIGKYVSNKAVIPEGSMFYSSMVIEWEELPSSKADDIGDGETIYALDVNDESTFGNSIFPGNYIDIYYQANLKGSAGNMPWIGKFIEGIKVLDVQDSNGNSVFETNGEPLSPRYLIFNISNDMYILFKKIELTGGKGQLFPVQRNANYSKQQHGAEIVGNEYKLWIEDKALSNNIVIGGDK